MRFTFEEIKQEIGKSVDSINRYRMMLDELADSYVPVYYNEVLKDWTEMPSEFNDSHLEHDKADDATIFDLMRMDLFFYYESLCQKAWTELNAELTECPECGEMSNDFTGDWCSDCDAKGGTI